MKAQHGTFGWTLEMAVAIAALVTSVTSIWLSLRQGDDMARLVQAQSWPYLEYETSNTGDNGEPEIDLGVRNAGVGPAKVESFAILYDGKAVKGWGALIKACCLPDGTPSDKPLDMSVLTDNRMISSKLLQRVLRASDSQILLHLPKTDANAALWKKLDDARFRIELRACYCSVFDECWTSNLRSTEQHRVDACPVEPVPYVE
ncbi:MAG TPA: hypothetical protein VKB52_12500 [Rhodanobacteraceae bacterium]|nr:hypothetical protein [Rhodanobacteraceae bacterium]